MKHGTKSVYGMIMAIFVTVMAIYSRLFWEGNNDYKWHIIGDTLILDISSLNSSSLTILGFFLWRQTVTFIVNKTYKATMITEPISIVWLH